MTRDADQIRADIERTRGELGSDVDALADKVTPSKIVHRQTDKVKEAFGSAKDHVLGVASDASDRVHDATSNAGNSISSAPGAAVAKAKGSAVGVGLIAFGVGLLVSSLIPASDKEKELASSVKDAAEPLVTAATDSAKEVADHLKEPAQDAAASLKDTATDAADAIKSEATGATGDIKDTAKHAKEDIQNESSSNY
jgi:hypothetical protein